MIRQADKYSSAPENPSPNHQVALGKGRKFVSHSSVMIHILGNWFWHNLPFGLSFRWTYLPLDLFSSSLGSVVFLRHCDFLLVWLLFRGRSLGEAKYHGARTLTLPEMRSTWEETEAPCQNSHWASPEADSPAPDDSSPCPHLEISWNPVLEPSSQAAPNLPFRNLDTVYYFKIVNLEVICYMAIDN